MICGMLTGLLCALTCSAGAAGVEWREAFKDDFEKREAVGPYIVEGGSAAIAEGRLRLGAGAMALRTMPITRDVRVEFDATAEPGVAPGGLSCILHSGSGYHYKFEFGADGNRVNRISGEGLNLVDDHPQVLIEPGRWYHLRAQREGKRLTCEVDGKTILDGTVAKVVGAEGIQRAGLVTERGMLVDNLRVSVRVPAHPDCCPPPLPWLPLTRYEGKVQLTGTMKVQGLAEAVAALNAKDFDGARRQFEAMDDVFAKLVGLAFLLGDVDYFERPVYGTIGQPERDDFTEGEIAEYFGEFGLFAERWKKEMQRHPETELLKAYWPLVQHFGRMALDRSKAPKHIEALDQMDDRINPFRDKALLYRARIDYWNGAEGGDAAKKQAAVGQMKAMLGLYPGNRVLREYAGEPVPWGEELNADTRKHPAWAAYLREAYARELAVIERCCRSRQRSDGQFGGGYGDDVEMLRRWVAIIAISSCSEQPRAAIERLADGVWTNVCEKGYAHGRGDVEHSAEPSADAFPTMLLLRYGDPRWYERNLQSCKTIHDMFMAIDEKGHPRFKSSDFGVERVVLDRGRGVDTGYHARVMKHFLWQAWYGNHEAKDWFLRWVDGWREVAMLDAPDKPAGVLPGVIWYPSGSYQPPDGGPWYTCQAGYGWWGLPNMIHDCFLDAYGLSGEDRFLRPVQLMMDWGSLGPLMPDSVHAHQQQGTKAWFSLPMAHVTNAGHTSLYRLLTGERVYDEYTRRFGNAAQLYPIDHDLERYMTGLEKAARSLRTNLWFRTTEVLSTDRISLPAVEEVWGAYTGAVTTTRDAEFPTFAVTYDTPSTDFASLVVEATPGRLRVWLYSFWDGPKTIALRPWRLEPGEYLMNQGKLVDGEFPFQHRYIWAERKRVHVAHRAERVEVTLPPGEVYVVDLRMDQPATRPDKLSDVALGQGDVHIEGDEVVVTLHNLGNAPATNVEVALQEKHQQDWTAVARARVAALPPPREFQPSRSEVRLTTGKALTGGVYRVAADPSDAVEEICEENNVVALH
jgi:hypothetical protein